MIYDYELQRLVSEPLTGWKRALRLSCHKLGSLIESLLAQNLTTMNTVNP